MDLLALRLLVANAAAARGAGMKVLRDPGATFVPYAVSCCYWSSKL